MNIRCADFLLNKKPYSCTLSKPHVVTSYIADERQRKPVQITGARWSGRGVRCPAMLHMIVFLGSSIIISLTECNTGTTARVTFVVNTTIQLKNITTIADNTGTLVSGCIARWMPLLPDVIVIFF
jgi:hypothetical protein